jgi:hypothetical protein
MKQRAAFLCICLTSVLLAQPPAKTATVPRLVKFAGALTDAAGKPLTGVAGVTFALYAEQTGGAPLWMETQNIAADPSGRYTAMLGVTRNDGIPAEVFASGQGRWLGVQPQGESERPRVLMVSVPYALQAADAETLGGLPPSAFALASSPALPGAPKPAQAAAHPDVTGTGTANYLSYWTSSTALGTSALYQTGGKVGLGTTTPGSALEVDTATASAILGNSTATSGSINGVAGQTASPAGNGVVGSSFAATGGNGVAGVSNATSGFANGVFGQNASTGGSGVWGQSIATTGYAVGVTGQTASPGGAAVAGVNNAATGGNGVNGISSATSGSAAGVYGQSASTSGNGVYGGAIATTGSANGVYGQSASTGGNGVEGNATAASGSANGVYGQSASTSGAGVNGQATAASGGTIGVYGQSASTSGAGVNGQATAASGNTSGVYGFAASTTGTGVFGVATAATGYNVGVNGFSSSTGGFGVQGNSPNVAVAGITQTCSGSTCTIVKGIAGQFVTAAGGTILQGLNGTTQVFFVDAKGDGHFAGNLTVTGKLTKGSGSFTIDHPLDPANRYLSHSFVESPDMMNVYNGMIRLDTKGEAWVTLPDYFEALNRDFRYQLTAIGAPAPRLYVSREVSGNRFKIAGGRPGGKVSWQVTGIRHDAYANAHRIPVAEDKPPAEQGTYLHPDVYGPGTGAGSQ